MFRHKGKRRTLVHNLRIASLLSFVAGVVNIAGFLAVHTLTTNVTGHFAFFIDEVFKLNLSQGLNYFLYILFFFLGSFISNIIVEIITKINDKLIYIIPVIIESVILFSIAIFGQSLIIENPNLLAFSLLFAMGMQNSLVTQISESTVRTTHLTGLFTDLGIELSQLFFHSSLPDKNKLFKSIKLRLTIILFFLIGGIAGGYLFNYIKEATLILAAIILLFALLFDLFRLNYYKIKKQLSDLK